MSTETETHGTETQVPNQGTTMARLVDRSRRNFLLKLSLAMNGIVGAALAVPILGYLLGPMKKDLPSGTWVGLGSLERYPEGETRLATFRNPTTTPWDGQTGEVSCWVRRVTGQKFQVFAINCAHLGCPVRWFEESKLFMCPCHGGAYYQDGSRASGPPERGLFEYKYKVANNVLSIDVHGLPTLATEARLNNPLVQIQGADGKKTGGCGCQG